MKNERVSDGPVLVVDDDPQVLRTIQETLESCNLMTVLAGDGQGALRAAENQGFAVAILDLRMPGMDGLEVLRRLQGMAQAPKVIMLTGHGTVETATEAMKLGAFDFLMKPVETERLLRTVREAFIEAGLGDPLVSKSSATLQEPIIVGESPGLKDSLDLLDRAAGTHLPVILQGETGTGKELFARRLHCRSGRSRGPFLAVNCGALPEELMMSELFGHERGAFTGAAGQKTGLYEAASGGTLFLDEVAELPRAAQVALLRTAETGEFRRVGSVADRMADVRLLAATIAPLRARVEEGKFRGDLYFRLAGFEVNIPPLRERAADIPDLVGHFLAEYSRRTADPRTMSESALRLLRNHSWPGNVRELRQVIERSAALSPEEQIGAENLTIVSSVRPVAKKAPDRLPSLAEVEGEHIRRVIELEGGNLSAAARALGVSTRTLQRRARKHDRSSGEPE